MSNIEIQPKVCSFFGHRNINITEELKQKVKETLEKLIIEQNVFIFLFGSRSNFDYLCRMVVTELKEKYPNVKRVAYTCKSETCILESERGKWEKIYSNLEQKEVHLFGMEEEYEYKTKYTAGKANYVERNQSMVNSSDFCVFYYNENYQPELRKMTNKSNKYHQPKSGTKLAYNYAKQKGKYIINLII